MYIHKFLLAAPILFLSQVNAAFPESFFLYCESENASTHQFEIDTSSMRAILHYDDDNKVTDRAGRLRITETTYSFSYIRYRRYDMEWTIRRHGGRAVMSTTYPELGYRQYVYQCKRVENLVTPRKPDF